MATYALPKSHQDVSGCQNDDGVLLKESNVIQMLEKSLVETDPEIAEIMVSDADA